MNHGEILSASIAVTFRDRQSVQAAIAQYREQFPSAKITGIDETIGQMLGPMRKAIQKASIVATVATALLTLLVTTLFMRMLVTKDGYPIAIMKSIGFTGRDIRRQYLTRSIIVLGIGVITGTLFGKYAGRACGCGNRVFLRRSSLPFRGKPVVCLFHFASADCRLCRCRHTVGHFRHPALTNFRTY
ncbi:FtsX-like permease family protein [Paenibacillus rhizoplanae]